MGQTIGGYDTNAKANQSALSDITITKSGTKTFLDIAIKEPIETNGGVPVNIQDQTTSILDWNLTQHLNDVTLATDTTVDNDTITLEAGHGVVVGNWLEFFEGAYFLQVEVKAVVTNTITLAMPIDQPFTTGASVRRTQSDLAVDGSVTPVTFSFVPGGTNKYDIVRAILHIEHTSAGDDSLFGNLPALTNGLYFRKKNAVYKNLFNAKDNGEFRHRAFDLEYGDSSKAGPGAYSTTSRRTFGGQNKNGVVIRVDPAQTEEIQAIVRDNLTTLTHLHIVIQGHIIQD